MSGLTLARAEAKLEIWLNADDAVAKKQSYSIDNRSLTRADAEEIRRNIDYWSNKVAALAAGRRGMRIRGVTPVG